MDQWIGSNSVTAFAVPKLNGLASSARSGYRNSFEVKRFGLAHVPTDRAHGQHGRGHAKQACCLRTAQAMARRSMRSRSSLQCCLFTLRNILKCVRDKHSRYSKELANSAGLCPIRDFSIL